MVEWIDLALLGDEEGLSAAINRLDASERATALADVAHQLGVDQVAIERAMLRTLVERVRPFALSSALWARAITASDDPEVEVRAHFARRGVTETPNRMRLALQLYAQFAEDRGNVRVQESDLKRCGYRCEHCGLAFCNEELSHKTLISPFGLRGGAKVDALKPHWNGQDSDRYPTLDHDWPVSLYGDNTSSNLRVLCRSCNMGKADYLALEQLRPWVGLPGRKQLLSQNVLSAEVFYTQLRRSPLCESTGLGPKATELTVQLRDPYIPGVLDNLVTVRSPDF